MNKFIRILNITLCVLLLAAIFINHQKNFVNSTYQSPNETVKNELESLIIDVNNKNSTILSFRSNCEVQFNISPIKLSGTIQYKKNNNFKMITESAFGKESEIGSNDIMFWFWSKRMEPRALYYAYNTDLELTRLKAPFNPVFVRQTLGLDLIDPTQLVLSQKRGDNYELTFNSELNVTRVVVINYNKCQILGQFLFQNNKLVASSEITEVYENGTPKSIVIKWFPENLMMTIKLYNNELNPELNSFEMPNLNPKINMAYN